MNELRNAVRKVSRKMFGGKLPRSHNEGTAFGMALAWELRPPTPDDLVSAPDASWAVGVSDRSAWARLMWSVAGDRNAACRPATKV